MHFIESEIDRTIQRERFRRIETRETDRGESRGRWGEEKDTQYFANR